jgi:hypothetical protein
MSDRPTLPVEAEPRDCWDWIRPDEAMRLTLAAYNDACAELEEIARELAPAAPTAATREDWLDGFMAALRLRLEAHGHDKGMENLGWAAEKLASIPAYTGLQAISARTL